MTEGVPLADYKISIHTPRMRSDAPAQSAW